MKRDYPDRPFVAVGVVVLRDNSVLLIKRNKPPKLHQWSIPGGGQDVGEALRETAMREVMEETGVRIKNLQLVDVLDLIDRDEREGIRHHYTLIDFTAEYDGGELCPGDDAADARWVPLADVEEYIVWDDTIDIIKKAARLADQ